MAYPSPTLANPVILPLRGERMEEFWQSLPPKLSKLKVEGRCYIFSTQTEHKAITDNRREVVATVSLARNKGHKCRLMLFNNLLVIINSSNTIVCSHSLYFVWVLDKPGDLKQGSSFDHSLVLQFPEETATVMCTDRVGKEKIMWTVSTAITKAMNLDTYMPHTASVEDSLRRLAKRDGMEYEFGDRNSDLYGGTYQGSWYKGYPDGSGELRNPVLGFLYIGSFRHGNFDGNGTLSMSRAADDTQGTSPAEYRGGFEKGKYHGYGDMKYYNDDRYEGHWLEGKRCGHGRYEERNGDRRVTVYFGAWENDKRAGYGVFEDTVRFIRYMGMFSNNARHGHGLLITSDGTYCETSFSNGEIGDGVEGLILGPNGHSFFGKIGPGLKLCGEGTLIVKQRMRGGLCMKGTFTGEWGKSVTMKNASLNGLFDSPPDQRATSAESQLTMVDPRIGFNYCRASDKWRSIVSHFQKQFEKDSGMLAMQRTRSVYQSKSNEVDLCASVPVRHSPLQRERSRSATGRALPPPSRDAETATQENVRKVLSDSSNPACHLLNRLAALYHESYSGLGTSPFLLPHAINEAKEMIRQIHALIRSLFPYLRGDHSLLAAGGLRHLGHQETMGDWVNIDSGYELIQPHVFERIFPTLFSLYVLHHEEQDSNYKRGIRILDRLSNVQLAKHLSLQQKLVDTIAKEGESSSVMKVIDWCVDKLDRLKTIFTPSGSVKCLKEVFEHISGYDRRQGMDESLPLVIMAVVRAKLPRLGAYVHFLYDFAWEQNQLPNTTEGFILTTFESVYTIITREAETWPAENGHE